MAKPTSVEEAAANLDALKPIGVALEKSSQDELDRDAQRHAALHNPLEPFEMEKQDQTTSRLSTVVNLETK